MPFYAYAQLLGYLVHLVGRAHSLVLPRGRVVSLSLSLCFALLRAWGGEQSSSLFFFRQGYGVGIDPLSLSLSLALAGFSEARHPQRAKPGYNHTLWACKRSADGTLVAPSH